MKMNYWIADCIADHARYSVRARTKKECLVLRAHRIHQNPSHRYGEPRKVSLSYVDKFDLMIMAASECGLYESDA